MITRKSKSLGYPESRRRLLNRTAIAALVWVLLVVHITILALLLVTL
ncbi:hypothetical protein [Spirochaeta africana]|uniref:Uncharacterized protein n=1 Tax=Spirochaeta africana (strain ATCC 700263 / DSM 8902 / Z-7692) TaxID=889378 RepID=H9UJF4_SPIAZ|nr:hypothetical protein [Spirochaeta africana]AFG37647.1 hypothetical protein Spiaf_1588 [Spirochaeta africana DSM 8902]